MKFVIKKQLLWLIAFCIVFFGVSMTRAQSTSVELLGTITASQATAGLGFNLDPGEDWEWAAAAAAGATHGRFQCSWTIVEQQSAPPHNVPGSPQYVQDPACLKAFASAKKYGIHPTIVAAFGAPYHKILGVSIPNGAPVGATSLDIELVGGVSGDTLANIKFPYDYICIAAAPISGQPSQCGTTFFTNNHSFQGALITGVQVKDSTHATIMLASKVSVALPADSTSYNISEILYPSTLTELATDPSVIAYGNYVSFLASSMAANGLTGDIELWNEPPYNSDPWDNRCHLYDADMAPPCPSTPGSAPGPNDANYGFVANIQNRVFPAGITATWNGTSGSGWASILGPRLYARTGVYAKQPATTVASESFHVYGFEPEEVLWTTDCLEATAKLYPAKASNPNNCALPGEPAGPNNSYAVQLDMVAKLSNPTFGVSHMVTETGILPPVAGLQDVQARFDLRQFIGFEAVGMTPVEFFKLWTGLPDPSFGFVEHTGSSYAFSPYPAYTALSGFMSDIQPISDAPAAAYPSTTLPSVASYSGTYPLTTVHMVGSRAGAAANSDAFIVWQRSFSPCNASQVCGEWITQTPPSAGPVTVNIPSALKVTQVVDLTYRTSVPYTISGNQISFEVADDPIEILVDPTSSSATSTVALPTKTVLTRSTATSSFATPVTLTAVVTPYSSKTNTTNGETVTFFSGSTQVGVGTLASGVASVTVTSLPVGTDTLTAQYAGDKSFMASAGFNSITVSNSSGSLSLPAISTQTYGVGPLTVVATSKSQGAITLSVVSGPARVATGTSTGGLVTINGIGTVTLGATQAAWSGYAASPMVTTSFTVLAKSPNLVFNPVADVVYGAGPFTVMAKSSSKAVTTYKVVSGPATVSGSTVSLKSAGTVVLESDQVASGNYTADSAQTSFTVNSATPTLQFKSVPNQTYGASPIAVSATSASSGAVIYAVVTGPATVAGNTVTITGSGTVVLKATQAASTNYKAPAPVQTSFTVGAARPTLAIKPFAAPTYGAAPFTISATSNSTGTITYKVLTGPATISGDVLTVTGASTVVIQAVQAASNNYTASTAQASFVVAPAVPQLALAPIQNMTMGAKGFKPAATSPSSGAITYTVVSGPATISNGSTVTVTGAGTVILAAKQAANGNYTASQTIETSFTVSDANAKTDTSAASANSVLTLSAIANQTYGAGPISVTALSKSKGAINLFVVSGPAIINSQTSSGGTITITGVGPVVIGASQAASGNYPAVPIVETSFTVLPANSQLTWNKIKPQKYSVAAPFIILAKSHARVPTVYKVISGPAIVLGDLLILNGTGTVLLEATQPAVGVWAASTVQTSFIVTP